MTYVSRTQAIKKQRRRKLIIEIVAIVGIALVFGLLMPVILPDFRLKLLGRFLSLSIVAIGIDLIWGYTGLLSLGHGIFFALGGYAFAMHLKLQLPEGEIPEFFTLYGVKELPFFWQPFYSFPFTLIAIVLIPSIVAGLLGYLVFRNRIKGVYFSILTQAALLVLFNFFNGQQKLINGTNGLKTDTETLFGMLVSSKQAQLAFYEISILCVVLIYLLCRWLTSGRFGRLLIAIRDDENRVRFSGYDPTGFKVLVFAVSGGIAGVAGALYTVQSGIVTPSYMEVAFSIEMVIWVAVGGRGTLVGAILGTLLVRLGQTLLSEQFPEVWLFFQGALFLIVVTVLPNGIVGWLRDEGIEQMRSLFGTEKPVITTYPSLEKDPLVQREKEEIGH
ncbi:MULTISPECIES: urea ABC transporter permease subunit UrtC [unclassified Moorena]|uniref:urea ABC transporter permease subunit UrtC n=1 Tax=unclassified Moorena TaxID=2683338 RepID=UPI0013B74794|nr:MULTISPECIES: urea ABC transporter permease subunit UrtC [unclassified Moorena]NEQ16487.1 urea ABC transporter permease subunit UrtC [Moorena sp. SIO3E2]NEP34351.1 urea ABC transporter permease subunit UrtC [Moorena sp. SIO3B2]NEQ04760.1 urea ABC transporter permease subunit UrtC [Moorena sp. SIO4E2]NER88749.1 urea ABC transporter permease subunit UrtC [Moorena sp. SIO3A2]NES40157.1 urea ABC transporter permease subunit UrtC [Moorena sp. SIO2C4]